MAKKDDIPNCSFCGKSGRELEMDEMLRSPIEDAFICIDCVETCNQIFNIDMAVTNSSNKTSSRVDFKIPNPKDIKATLDDYVVGQDEVKKVLAVGVYNHYKRLMYLQDHEAKVEIEKSNILLAGPTGTGKTLLAKTLAKTLQVPFTVCDATTLTEAGYVGDDVENVLVRLLQAADGDVEAAERGIIYIDELDKVGRKGENTSITRDVSGEGVQQSLLKIIEGTISSVPPNGGRKHPNQETIKINTENILFICGGAFVGLDKLVKRRTGSRVLGFTTQQDGKKAVEIDETDQNLMRQAEPHDLVHFGLIPELIGRLPVFAVMNKLEKSDLLHILTQPRNAIVKQYQALFEMEDVKLDFNKAALEAIADEAIKRDTGARGLRSILEKSMTDIMFELKSTDGLKKVVITEKTINEGTEPKLTFK